MKIADNVTDEQLALLQPPIEQRAGIYRDEIPGGRYAITFVPGEGALLSLNDQTLGTIPGDDFARAFFAVWLGSNPIDRSFRDLLLGAS